jgi:hypothetical protein
MQLDHVLIAVADFEAAAAALWSDHGLEAREGGRHPSWGTANWLVPLGSSYLELVGIADPAVAATSTFGRRALEVLGSGGGPYAWCVRADDLDATSSRLGLAIESGSRHRPDGQIVSWRMAGLDTAMRDPSRPFFIEWTVPPSLHPGRSPVRHRAAAPELAWIEVAGDAEGIRSWLGEQEMPVRLREGEPAVLAVGIVSGGEESVLR